jgi:hypothetical protein
MPYRKLEPDTTRFQYNPKFVGMRTKEEISQQHEGRVPGFLKAKIEQEATEEWGDLLE